MSTAFASFSYVSFRKRNLIIRDIFTLNDVQGIAKLIMDKFHLDRRHRNISRLNYKS